MNAAGVLSDLDTVNEQPGLQIHRDSKNRFPSLLVNKRTRHQPASARHNAVLRKQTGGVRGRRVRTSASRLII